MALKVTLQIVLWNSANDLALLLPCLKPLPDNQVKVRFIDNASKDDSVAQVKMHLPGAEVIRNERNVGYGRGHNIGFRQCDTPFVATLNPDLHLIWESFYPLLNVFSDAKVGAIQGLLVRNNEGTIIDSAGIVLTRSLNGQERASGKSLATTSFYNQEIIAPTGACGLYRMSALKDVAYKKDEILDEDFFAYKEDVDLGWRLARRGWKTTFVPQIIGIHRRRLKEQGKIGWSLRPSKMRQRLRDRRTYYSLRNWVWLVTKNASIKELIVSFPFVTGRLFIMVVLSLLQPGLFQLWGDAASKISLMIDKRRYTARPKNRF